MPIYDLDDNILYSASFAVRSGESAIGTYQVDCESGWSLYGQSVSQCVVEARHGQSGGWTNIETTPIDLTTWDGSKEIFQVRVTAPTITTPTKASWTFTVRRTT